MLRKPVSKPLPRHAQVEPPDADPFGAGKAHGVVEVLVEAPCPVAQGLGVVVAELLYVADGEARSLQCEQDPREVERFGVGEDVALGEGAGLGVGVAEAGDAVVEQPSARLEQPRQVCA